MPSEEARLDELMAQENRSDGWAYPKSSRNTNAKQMQE